MTEMTQADLDRLCLEYGRLLARAVQAERIVSDLEIEVQDIRAQLAALNDRLYRPPDADEGGEP